MFDKRELVQIADAFGLGEPVSCSEPASRGEQGRISRLETTTGAWAVKELFGRTDDRDVVEAAAFQSAAQAAGVPSPRLVRGPFEQVVIDLGTARVRVYEWVDLAEPNPFLDPAEVGRVVAMMHRVRFAGRTPVDPWYTEPVGSLRWGQLDRELTAADAPFAGDFGWLRGESVALETLLRPPRELRTCHRDLFADNLRSTTSGQLCVIDWDDCGLADPVQELCLVLYEFGRAATPDNLSYGSPADRSDATDVSRAKVLYEAYIGAGGPARISGPGDFAMLIAQLGHINERAAVRWLAASPGDPERTRMASLIGESCSYPLTCNLIDRIVDLIST